MSTDFKCLFIWFLVIFFICCNLSSYFTFKPLEKYQLGYFGSFPYILRTTCNYTNGKCIHLEQEGNLMKKPNLTVLTHANTLTLRIFFIANLKEDLSDWPTLGWAFWSMLREYPHAMMPSSTIGTGVQMIQSELVFLSIAAVM